jgi:hypothetical protein
MQNHGGRTGVSSDCEPPAAVISPTCVDSQALRGGHENPDFQGP